MTNLKNLPTSDQVDSLVGMLCIAIGKGEFRSAVANMFMLTQKEAYDRGLAQGITQGLKQGVPLGTEALAKLYDDYSADQWWVKELTAMFTATTLTPDAKRAANILTDFMRKFEDARPNAPTGNNEICPDCGNPWLDHDFGVPAPSCP